ncbi:MAG: hypothetical protein IPJ68_01430 [Candidatus Moraniibacteriota bacterium]|nr:MAG: hypothetical protein IPJ68_01430 [Candidatus Moranbacteria bacterium]
MKHIKGALPRVTGKSNWAVRLAEKDQTVPYPIFEVVARIAQTCFHLECTVDPASLNGDWEDTLILIIPSGSLLEERNMFLQMLTERMENNALRASTSTP